MRTTALFSTIDIPFTSTPAGTRSAKLRIRDNATNSPLVSALSSTGQDFLIAVDSSSSASATVTAGQTAIYKVKVNPVGGFNGSVNLSCTGAPLHSRWEVSPSVLVLDVASAEMATLTVSTIARSRIGVRVEPPPERWTWLWVLGLLAARVTSKLVKDRHHAWRRAWAPVVLGVLRVMLWVSCGVSGGVVRGGDNSGTAAGTYSLSVLGNHPSGTKTIQQALTLTLTVN